MSAVKTAFPSPCGVLVLKLEPLEKQQINSISSFRPLAGFWFLNLCKMHNGYART